MGTVRPVPGVRLSVHIYAGDERDRAADLAPGGVDQEFRIRGKFHLQARTQRAGGIEASQARTQYLDSALRLNNHYDLALAYLF